MWTVEQRFEITVGTGNAGCEAISSELNERIMRLFQNFCTSMKPEKKEEGQEAEVHSKSSLEKSDSVVYSL